MNLQQIIKDHERWLTDPTKGSCANLIGANLIDANLTGANLEGANLDGANLNGANLKGTNIQAFSTAHHIGFLHEDILTIGCESHYIKHWRKYIKEIGKRHNYSDEEIKQTITLIKCLLKIQKENKLEGSTL